MGRSRLVLAVLLSVFPLAACSSTSDTGGTTTDAGKKDSGVKDGGDASTGSDTGPATDTGPAPDGATTDTGGGKSCDQHTGDECDLVKQNCTDASKSCVYDNASKHNVCESVTFGTKLKGEGCAAPGDCDKGLFCFSGKCSPACCSGDSSVCGAGGSCNLAITDPDTKAVVYHACSYSAKCNPFKYDCPTGQMCLFSSEPDVFKCSSPAGGASSLGVAPGGACEYINDCGESQGCFSTTTDAGKSSKCLLFCWLMTPAGFAPGTKPDGRFPADGNCTIGGKSYGTCKSAGGIGGGLGVCQP